MTVSFGGLISGLDTSSLITQLVAAERSSATTLQTKQTNLNTQKSIVASLSSALAALGTAARGVDTDSELRPRTGSVSDSHATVAVSSAAEPGTHEVRVKQLATASVTASHTFSSSGAGVAGDGTLKITVAGVEKSIDYTSSDTLDNLATKINAAGAGVSASVLFDGTTYRLLVGAKGTGTAQAPTFTDTGSALGLADPANVKIPARDAVVSIDGVDVTRSSNIVADALPGVTLTLNSVAAAADPTSKLAVTLDGSAITSKIKGIVTAYNAVNSALHVQLDYTGTAKGQNTLFGDSTLRQLQSSLAGLMSRSYGDQSLASVGISRDKTGAMTLDESKLTAALASDPDVARKLFVTNAFATTLSTLTDGYTTSSTGVLASKTTSLTARYKTLQTQIDHVNAAADSMQARLEKQFNALEQAMSSLKSQSSYLTSALASTSSSS